MAPNDSHQLVKFVKDNICSMTPDQFSLLIEQCDLNMDNISKTPDVLRGSGAGGGGGGGANPKSKTKKRDGAGGSQLTTVRREELTELMETLLAASVDAEDEVKRQKQDLDKNTYDDDNDESFNARVRDERELRRLRFEAEKANLALGAAEDELNGLDNPESLSNFGPVAAAGGIYNFRKPRLAKAAIDAAGDDLQPVFFDNELREQIPTITAYPLERAVQFFYDYRVRTKALWPVWHSAKLSSYVQFIDALSPYLQRMRAEHLMEKERFRRQLKNYNPASLQQKNPTKRLSPEFYNAAFIERYFGTMPRLVNIAAALPMPEFSYWVSPYHDPWFEWPEPDDDDDRKEADSDSDDSDDEDRTYLRAAEEANDRDDSPPQSDDDKAYDVDPEFMEAADQKLNADIKAGYENLTKGKARMKNTLSFDEYRRGKQNQEDDDVDPENYYQNYRSALKAEKERRRAGDGSLTEIHVNTSIYWSPLKSAFDEVVLNVKKLTSEQTKTIEAQFEQLNRMYTHTIDENLRAIEAYMQLAAGHRVGIKATMGFIAQNALGSGSLDVVKIKKDEDAWSMENYHIELKRSIAKMRDRVLGEFDAEASKGQALRVRLPLWEKAVSLQGLLLARWFAACKLLIMAPNLEASDVMKERMYKTFINKRDAEPQGFAPAYSDFFPPNHVDDASFTGVVGDVASAGAEVQGWQAESAQSLAEWRATAAVSEDGRYLIDSRSGELSLSNYAMYETSRALFEAKRNNTTLTIDEENGTIVLCLWDRNEVYGCVRSITERRVTAEDADDSESLIIEDVDEVSILEPKVLYDCTDHTHAAKIVEYEEEEEEEELSPHTAVCRYLKRRLEEADAGGMKAVLECALFSSAKSGIVLTLLVQRAAPQAYYHDEAKAGQSYAQNLYVDICFMPQCAMAYVPSNLEETQAWCLRRALSFAMIDIHEDVRDKEGMQDDLFFRSVRQCLYDARMAYLTLNDYMAWTVIGPVINKFAKADHIQAALEKDLSIIVGVENAAVPLLTEPDALWDYGVLPQSLVALLASDEHQAPPHLPRLVARGVDEDAEEDPQPAAKHPTKKRKTATAAAFKTARCFYLGQMKQIR